MKKINIAKLLKHCPQGMELNCTVWDDVVFVTITWLNDIIIRRNSCVHKHNTVTLNEYGCLKEDVDNKCIIFPKNKTTWEGFVPLCKFKGGELQQTRALGLTGESNI